MKITFRGGVPTKTSLQKILNNRAGFSISDIYSPKYPRILVHGNQGNATVEQVVSALQENGIEVVGVTLSHGMASGRIEIKNKLENK